MVLGIYTDEHDVLRCRGRIADGDLLETTKFPIYLPKDNPGVKLIIKEAQRRVMLQELRTHLQKSESNFG